MIAMHCGKVLMGQGYVPGAEVQLLALHNIVSVWEIILTLKDQTFQNFPLKNIALDFIEYI